MGFAQLHIHHSGGSMLDAVSSSEDYAKRASEYNHKYLAATDHGRLTAWYNLQQACNKYDLNPIFGLEQYIVPDDELVVYNDKDKRVRCKNNHIILLAKNEIGMKNIMHLHYISMADTNHFYYNNHSTFSEIFKYSEGVICGTACMMSPFSNLLKQNKTEEAESLFKTFLSVFKDDFYVELQINELTKELEGLPHGQKSTNDFMEYLADKYGVMKVITGDVHYLDKEDWKIQDISLAMREKRTAEQPGFTIEAKSLYYHNVEDYKFLNERFEYGYTNDQIDQWCSNTEIIAKRCNCKIKERTKMIFPTVTTEDEFEMEKLAKEGLCKLFNVENYKDAPKEYVDRMETELQVLKEKGFGSYCMVLWDIFRYCRENDIPVGFGRGCFVPGSKVLLSNGEFENIENIQANENVITGFGLNKKVYTVFEYDVSEEMSKIVTNTNEEINCTKDHKILVVKRGLDLKIENAKFIKAEDIEPGDYLIKIKDFVEVKENKTFDYAGKVYDLKIHGEDHSYTINGYSVHNSGAGSLVLYLLGITKIDSIQNKLIFERFLSRERSQDTICNYFE